MRTLPGLGEESKSSLDMPEASLEAQDLSACERPYSSVDAPTTDGPTEGNKLLSPQTCGVDLCPQGGDLWCHGHAARCEAPVMYHNAPLGREAGSFPGTDGLSPISWHP